MSELHGELAPSDVAVEKLLKGDVDAVIVTAPLPQESVARVAMAVPDDTGKACLASGWRRLEP